MQSAGPRAQARPRGPEQLGARGCRRLAGHSGRAVSRAVKRRPCSAQPAWRCSPRRVDTGVAVQPGLGHPGGQRAPGLPTAPWRDGAWSRLVQGRAGSSNYGRVHPALHRFHRQRRPGAGRGRDKGGPPVGRPTGRSPLADPLRPTPYGSVTRPALCGDGIPGATRTAPETVSPTSRGPGGFPPLRRRPGEAAHPTSRRGPRHPDPDTPQCVRYPWILEHQT
jgi:hypothetical protein